jgi:hypothetical protein
LNTVVATLSFQRSVGDLSIERTIKLELPASFSDGEVRNAIRLGFEELERQDGPPKESAK